MQAAQWNQAVLTALAASNIHGQEAVRFIRQHNVSLGFQRQSASTGARWLLPRRIRFNARYYSLATAPDDPSMLSLLVHEVHHLKQGMLTALSVYGELDAWQVGFRFYRFLDARPLHPAVEELLLLPLSWDRHILRHAANLMQAYAGKGYRINWLPYYPLHLEAAYRLTGHIARE